MADLTAILEERGAKYGNWTDECNMIHDVMATFGGGGGYASMNNGQKEAFRRIVGKLARLANGDPNHDDSWIDVAGYAQLGSRCID